MKPGPTLLVSSQRLSEADSETLLSTPAFVFRPHSSEAHRSLGFGGFSRGLPGPVGGHAGGHGDHRARLLAAAQVGPALRQAEALL